MKKVGTCIALGGVDKILKVGRAVFMIFEENLHGEWVSISSDAIKGGEYLYDGLDVTHTH